ncbi:MAG: hypothetical protein GEU93_05780 [Propionibacteriales bacterium]|nr:hypothetical protein [Propionibacteriales bacterium]
MSPAAPNPITQGTLALDFTLPTGVPATPRPPALTLIVGGDDPPEPPAPPARAWAGRFVQAVVEVLAGDRPVQQLVRWTNQAVYADLNLRVRRLGIDLRAPQRIGIARSHVRSVHICQPHPEVAEVAAHVRQGGRSRAIAARFEAVEGRWQCTALQLG